jgi:hypothetical protein
VKWIVFVATAMCVGSAQAAVIHIKPMLTAVYDQDFNDITMLAVVHYDNEWVRLAPVNSSVESYIVQVDFSLAISDLQAGQLGFGNARFNLGFDKELSPSPDFPGWRPEVDRVIDSNGPAPGGVRDKWAVNGDFGVSGDLRKIIVGNDPSDFGPVNVDPRRRFGQDRDEYFGTVFVEFPAIHSGIGRLLVKPTYGSVYNANYELVTENVTMKSSQLRFLGSMPEPPSGILLGLGGMLLAVVGRRWRVNSIGRSAVVNS